MPNLLNVSLKQTVYVLESVILSSHHQLQLRKGGRCCLPAPGELRCPVPLPPRRS